jgi:transposase
MYIRKSVRAYGGKTYTNYLLVESVQTPKGPRQKTVCSLGDLSPRPREEWLKLARKIEDALTGQGELIGDDDAATANIIRHVREQRNSGAGSSGGLRPLPVSNRTGGTWIKVNPSRVTTEHHREAGPVHVGYQFWKRLELDRILRDLPLPEAVCQLVCIMTLNRLIAPSSEHAMPAWVRRTALTDILGVDVARLDEQSLYRVLDKIHPHRATIEGELVQRERNLFSLDPTIYLDDLSSTYFEGQATRNPKALRGYSRDHRPDCKQIVVGLVVNRDGFPIAHEIFAGNTQDRATLAVMLDHLRDRVGFAQGATIILDRGMAFDENIAEINQRKLNYVVASRQPERDRWLADFEDTEGFAPVFRQPSPRNPAQKKTTIEVKTRVDDTQTYVLCRSQQRIAKDQAIRAKHEQRLLADIERLSRRIARKSLVCPDKINQAIGRLQERYPRVARYYKLSYDPHTATLLADLDPDKHAKAEQLDGCYLLKTNRRDLTGDELWRIYALLARAENAFRDMKSPLAERPIFHHRQERVESHIFLCVLAYHLLVAIEKTLLDQAIHTSWETQREMLKTHQICTVVLPTSDGSYLRIRKSATPEPDLQQLYQSLNISPHIIKPQQTWTTAG